MEILTQLLERKNLCLRSFLSISVRFLQSASQGNTEGLGAFQENRRKLLNVVTHIDEQVAPLVAAIGTADGLAPDVRAQVAELDRIRMALSAQIIETDSQILSEIEKIKHETLQKIQELSSGKRQISAYKSPMDRIDSVQGNTLLNHEA